MLKEKEVLVKINSRNINYYRKKGYQISLNGFTESKEFLVKTVDIPKNSHHKVLVICELCSEENIIPLQKYYVNVERNNKGYYSCFSCKKIENQKTCMSKYGVKSYSQTPEFKESESKKWKGIQKGAEKGRRTTFERYGVESFFQTDQIREMNRAWMSSDEFKEKSKETHLQKYGVDKFCKTDEFKQKMNSNKDAIVDKIKQVFLGKYGVDWPSKIESVVNKSLKTREENGQIIPLDKLSEFEKYRKLVRKFTNRSKKILFECWSGFDYYDGEFIKGNFSFSHTHRLYPTIDHKISIFYGFLNNIKPEEIGDIKNLCITKRFINSTKRELIEEAFRSNNLN
jgi:hypothetical protein